MKQLTWILTVLLLGVYIVGPLADPDLWWHIAVGRFILAHQKIPTVDYWNTFAAGKPWIAYSWSQEILYAVADRFAGAIGLQVLQVLLACGLALTFCTVSAVLARDWFIGLLLGTLATVGCLTHFHLRPQALAWILFALALCALEQMRRQSRNIPALLLLFICAVLWANTHLSTVILVGTSVVWAFFAPLLPFSTRLLILVVTITGTFCTPYFGTEWLTFFAKSGHPFLHGTIIEFGPATIREYATGFLVILWTLLAVGYVHAPYALPLGFLGWAMFVSFGALTVVKFVPFALVLVMVLVAVAWNSTQGSGFGRLGEGLVLFKARALKCVGVGLAVLLFALASTLTNNLFVAPIDKERVPEAAVKYIDEKALPAPILNAFGEGGYLMLRATAQDGTIFARVPIDGRTNVNEDLVTSAYLDALQGRQGWKRYIDLVQPRTILWKNASPLVSLLVLSPEWCRVFRDGSPTSGFSVFISQQAFNERYDLTSDDCVATVESL